MMKSKAKWYARSLNFKRWLPYFGGIIVFVLIVALCTPLISPVAMTNTTMFTLQQRILMYAAQHNQLPQNLDVLPAIPGKRLSVTDGWQRRIAYRVFDDNMVELLSLGEDGMPGGTETSEDITVRFSARNDKGEWSASEW